jgi:hypothetical protein
MIKGDPSMRIQIELMKKDPTPLQKKAARLLELKLQDTTTPVVRVKPTQINLDVQPDIGPEGFRITGGKDGIITVLGNDDRGLLYGVGKLLRVLPTFSDSIPPAPWQIESVPALPVRGMYFATHFHNFYHDAPLAEVNRYIEELALWGCNALLVWFDMHHYDSLQDPKAQEMIHRLRVLLQAANEVGMGAGLLFLANEGYRSSPEKLRVTPAPMQYNVEICPSKPQGLDLILKWRHEVLACFADLDIEYVCIWPHDQGGCGCADCNPWGAKGFVTLVRTIKPMIKAFFPAAHLIVSTWCFDYHVTGEYAGLWDAVEQEPEMLDYLMVDAHDSFPQYVLDHGVPANKLVLNFPEISMHGMHPWGGFGINPLPRHIDRLWQPSRHLLAGGFPYSEGIYEDINKVLLLQRDWDPPRALADIMHEYAAAVWSPRHAVTLAEVLTALEPQELIRIHRDLKPELFSHTHAHDPEVLSDIQERPLYTIPDSTKENNLLDTIEKDLPEAVRLHWRWRILRIRALLGAELARSGGKATAVSEACFAELTRIYHAQHADPPVKPPSLALIKEVFRG